MIFQSTGIAIVAGIIVGDCSTNSALALIIRTDIVVIATRGSVSDLAIVGAFITDVIAFFSDGAWVTVMGRTAAFITSIVSIAEKSVVAAIVVIGINTDTIHAAVVGADIAVITIAVVGTSLTTGNRCVDAAFLGVTAIRGAGVLIVASIIHGSVNALPSLITHVLGTSDIVVAEHDITDGVENTIQVSSAGCDEEIIPVAVFCILFCDLDRPDRIIIRGLSCHGCQEVSINFVGSAAGGVESNGENLDAEIFSCGCGG